MTHSFDVIFDPEAVRETLTRTLDLVITPVDDFTGQVVQAGVTAEIPAERATARRSLSGHLVFEGLGDADPQTVHVIAAKAGYFDPEPLDIVMPQDRATRILRLIRRPDQVADGESMVVRGEVRRASGAPVSGQAVQGLIAGVATPFRTRTNDQGSFALRLRPPPPILSADPIPVPVTADVVVRFPGAAAADRLIDDAEDMRTRVLPAPVVLP